MNLEKDLTTKVPAFGSFSRNNNNRVHPMQTTIEVCNQIQLTLFSSDRLTLTFLVHLPSMERSLITTWKQRNMTYLLTARPQQKQLPMSKSIQTFKQKSGIFWYRNYRRKTHCQKMRVLMCLQPNSIIYEQSKGLKIRLRFLNLLTAALATFRKRAWRLGKMLKAGWWWKLTQPLKHIGICSSSY